MDALKSFVAWPIYNFQAYGMLGLGWTIASLPLILRLCTKGIKSFGQFTEVFAFFSNLPLGQHVFSSLIYLTAPYSGSIGSTTRYLGREGDLINSVVTMEDRPWLRNPFGSLHAVALTNLGELASGVCMVAAMQHAKGIKGIPVQIDTSYHKKARGTITGRSSVSLKALEDNNGEYKVTTTLTDKKGAEVAVCVVTWSMRKIEKQNKKCD